jgi:hypothetical protein
MAEFIITRSQPVNFPLLVEQIEAILGADTSVSRNSAGIVINTEDELTAQEQDAVRIVVLQHNQNDQTEVQATATLVQEELSTTKATAKAVLDNYDTIVAQATTGWAGMDTNTKINTLANILLETSKIVRYLGYLAYNDMV